MNSSKIINSILLLFLTTTISLSQAPPPTPVEVALVEEKVLKRPVSFVGNVVPFKRSVIASEVEGLVVQGVDDLAGVGVPDPDQSFSVPDGQV